jgi:hypothetical protein
MVAYLSHTACTLDLFHQIALQQLVGAAVGCFSVYYMLGFGPLTVLGWLAIHRGHYRNLRSLLFVSVGTS